MSRFPKVQQYSTSADAPMNYTYDYSLGESSSSALPQNHASSSSQSLPSDLPDLYYDYGTPPSASSNMICTPPLEWETPWQPAAVSQGGLNQATYLPSSWPSSHNSQKQSTRSMLGPMVDTNFDWTRSPFTGQPSELFAGFDDIGGQPHCDKPASYSHPYSQGALLTQPITSFGLAPPSPLPETVSPAALSNPSRSSSEYSRPSGSPPIKLHQPRPSRRIPIISLDRLASACEEESIRARRKEHRSHSHSHSPLPLSRPSHSTSYRPRNHHHLQQAFPAPHNYSSNILPVTNQEKVLICKCGCMESYKFRL